MATGLAVDGSDDTIAVPGESCSVKLVNTGSEAILIYVEGLHSGYATTAKDLTTGFTLAAGANETIRIGTLSIGRKFGLIHFKTAGPAGTMDAYKVASI